MSRHPQNPGNPIQFVRCTLGLSQVQFAARLGLSRSLVAKLEAEEDGYHNSSNRVRKLITREFGAILQPPGAPHPALDFDQQVYTLASLEKHEQRGLSPLPDDYPVEAIGAALTWVGSAAQKSGLSASFLDVTAKAMERLNKAHGLAESLDQQIRTKAGIMSARDYIAVTWLLQFFDLPWVKERLPRFVGCGKDGQPIFELNLKTAGTKPTSPTGHTVKTNKTQSEEHEQPVHQDVPPEAPEPPTPPGLPALAVVASNRDQSPRRSDDLLAMPCRSIAAREPQGSTQNK